MNKIVYRITFVDEMNEGDGSFQDMPGLSLGFVLLGLVSNGILTLVLSVDLGRLAP